jgi:Predicted transcriptional regulator containing the HTH domain
MHITMKQMSDINEVANQIEAILLATPEPLTKGEIAGKLNADIGEIGKAMNLLKKRYEGTALELKNYGKKYKIVIREEYSEIAYRYSELELNKGELEILAFLFKNKKAYLTQIKDLEAPKQLKKYLIWKNSDMLNLREVEDLTC